MKMILFHTGTLDIDNPRYVKVKTLEGLLKLIEDLDHPVIISKPTKLGYGKIKKEYVDILNHWMIEIYDDYRE